MRELYEFIEQLYIEARQADDRQNGRRWLMLGYTKGTADATRGIARRLERVAAICVKLTKTGDGPFPEFVVSDERTGEILGIESHIRIVGIARISMAENGEIRIYPSPESDSVEYENGTVWAT